jgi:hypothetical protein
MEFMPAVAVAEPTHEPHDVSHFEGEEWYEAHGQGD